MKRVLASAAILTVLLLSALSASAATPVKYTITFTHSGVLQGIADFDITVDSVYTLTEIDFSESPGGFRASQHFVEQDTFSANGKSLVSEPYTFNVELRFDGSGNLISYDVTGMVVKVRLPQGPPFISAGFIDWMDQLDQPYVLQPDRGGCQNLEGFIAALSP